MCFGASSAPRSPSTRKRPEQVAAEASAEEAVYLEQEVRDDQLRMLFVCANPEDPARIAARVRAEDSAAASARRRSRYGCSRGTRPIYKRLQRARATLREHVEELDAAGIAELASRLPAVLEILYLLFTEGYSSAQPDELIRRELCEEAIRLGRLSTSIRLAPRPRRRRCSR